MDYLIAQCDDSDHNGTQEISLMEATLSPFTVFSTAIPATSEDLLPPEIPVSTTVVTLANVSDSQRDHDLRLNHTLSSALIGIPDWSHSDRFLLDHYVNHVARLMMPFHHSRNPWKTHYPAVASRMRLSSERALHSAILAHAAFNLSVLRGDEENMFAAGSRYYSTAIQHLVPNLTLHEEASSTVAAIMTLMMAEVGKNVLAGNPNC